MDRLRRLATPFLSLVAVEDGGAVVGHIAFTPVTLDADATALLFGLAPMAVSPAHQRQGIGTALLYAGLDACRAAGASAVVVLGHPSYYPRVGFSPASAHGLTCGFEVPDEAFMAMELVPGALEGVHGTVRYHEAFPSAGT